MSAAPRRVAFMLELQWPFKRHTGIFAGAQHYAQEQGWESTIDDYVAEELPARRTKPLPYDGVIGRASKKLAERAERLGLPVVNTWLGSPVREQLPGVFPDLASRGRMRAEHLLARGLRRFASLDTGGYASKVEVAAFQATVREAGFPCVTASLPLHSAETYATWKKHEQRIANSMSQWQPPIGVFAMTEEIGRMVAQMCRRRDWRVPHDVAIICGRNEESLCEQPRPSLSSVEVGYERIGYEAARMLDRLMKQKPSKKKGKSPPEHILLPPTGLVVRESTDFFAVDDPTISAALAFIAANSHRQIRTDDVARAVHTGLRTLQHHFQDYLGRSISAEIQRVRIERAKRELAQSKRPIQQIAKDVGFGRAMRMYEAFRRELGVTPREYRKKRQMEDAT